MGLVKGINPLITLGDIMTEVDNTKYDLPRPSDSDWLAANPGTSYECSICKARTKHNERYDAYYCEACNRWEEKGCEDSTCPYCPGRPNFPSEV